MRRCWATRLLWPLMRGPIAAEITDEVVRVRLGILGRAEIPVALVDRLSTMRWPWWGGLGVRLAPRLVAFATAWGPSALLELSEPVAVRTPFRWSTRRVVISVDDVEGFLRAVAHARAAAGAQRELAARDPSQ